MTERKTSVRPRTFFCLLRCVGGDSLMPNVVAITQLAPCVNDHSDFSPPRWSPIIGGFVFSGHVELPDSLLLSKSSALVGP